MARVETYYFFKEILYNLRNKRENFPIAIIETQQLKIKQTLVAESVYIYIY